MIPSMTLGSLLMGTVLAVAAPAAAGESPGTVLTRKGEPRRPPRVEPTLSLSSTLLFRALVLEQQGQTDRDRALLWKPVGLWVGAQGYYRRDRSWATGGLRGQLALGSELMTRSGSFTVGLQHTTGYEWHVRPRMSVFLGGRVTFVVDPANLDQSHAELGAPLGLSWRRVELQVVPALSLPLAMERREVFDGELREGVDINFIPLNVMLTFKLGKHRG